MAWTHIRPFGGGVALWLHRHESMESKGLTGAAAAPTGGLDGADWRLQGRL